MRADAPQLPRGGDGDGSGIFKGRVLIVGESPYGGSGDEITEWYGMVQIQSYRRISGIFNFVCKPGGG